MRERERGKETGWHIGKRTYMYVEEAVYLMSGYMYSLPMLLHVQVIDNVV